MTGRLDGKATIITGGTSGIGRRAVERFAAEGANVVFTGRQEEKGAAIEAEVPGSVFVRADAASEEETTRVFETVTERFGRLDAVFLNAGAPGVYGPIESTDLERFDRTVAGLFRSVMLGMKHAAPIMKSQGSGSIISNASVAGHGTGYGPHVYSACKAAVAHLTRSVASELGPFGIRANSISPGFIATPIFGRSMGLDPDSAETSTDRLSELGGKNPMGRIGEGDDIAAAAVFLASDDSTYITGQDLIVDGGLTLGQSWDDYDASMKRLGGALRH